VAQYNVYRENVVFTADYRLSIRLSFCVFFRLRMCVFCYRRYFVYAMFVAFIAPSFRSASQKR